jgi:hypothetical protein
MNVNVYILVPKVPPALVSSHASSVADESGGMCDDYLFRLASFLLAISIFTLSFYSAANSSPSPGFQIH